MALRITITESAEDADALADLLEHIAEGLREGYTSGYHPGWEVDWSSVNSERHGTTSLDER